MNLEFGDRKATYHQYRLSNGSEVYHIPSSDIDHSHIRIIIPFGWLYPHTPKGILRFLPQILGKRSPSFPDENSFLREIRKFNGRVTISLKSKNIVVSAALPNPDLALNKADKEYLQYLQKCLGELIFSPIVEESDLSVIKDNLRNKRDHAAKFFPGDDESSYILDSQWMNDGASLFESKFGYSNEEAINTITPQMLQNSLATLYRSNMQIVCGGNCSALLESLEDLNLDASSSTRKSWSLYWQNPNFRYIPVPDLHGTYALYFGMIHPEKTTVQDVYLSFFLEQMIDGLIHNRYREEQQLLYSWETNTWWRDMGVGIKAKFNLNNQNDVEYVANDISEQIETMIDDGQHLSFFVQRKRNQRFDLLETTEDVITALTSNLENFGRIVTEEEQYNQILEQAKDPKVMKALWNQMETGSICLYPAEFDQ